MDLGIQLGQRRSFAVVSGRCTAAHAETLRKIRDEKLYRTYTTSWEAYCGPHLKITRRHADRLIAQLNEFGPAYFEIAAMAGLTPEQYRAIEPCIRENALHLGAEVIALIPANSPAIADAVTRMLAPRRSSGAAPTPTKVPTVMERIAELELEMRATAQHYEHLLNSRISVYHQECVVDSLRSMRILLGSLIPPDF